MIALDTNVLVRYLVQDHATQSARASQVIQEAVENGLEIFLSSVVLCELVWVLESAYRRPREEIVSALDRIAATRGIVLGDRDAATRALDRYRTGSGDFADHLIGAQAVAAGADRVVTFDKALLVFPEFEAP